MAVAKLLLLAIVSITQATELKQRIEKVPQQMAGVNIDALLGRWFVQYRKAPCSWPGSTQFTDYVANFAPQGKSLVTTESWRSPEFCTYSRTKFFPTGPAAFIVKDGIGDAWSGSMRIIATDYKSFLIVWGCTKMSAFGKSCEDPWVSILTRQPFPGTNLFNVINNILGNSFGVTLAELQKVIHRKPCSGSGNVGKKAGKQGRT